MNDNNKRSQGVVDNPLPLMGWRSPFLFEQDEQTRMALPFLSRVGWNDTL